MEIIIYTRSKCGPCNELKKKLNLFSIKHTAIDYDNLSESEQITLRNSWREMYDMQSITFPVIFRNENHIKYNEMIKIIQSMIDEND